MSQDSTLTVKELHERLEQSGQLASAELFIHEFLTPLAEELERLSPVEEGQDQDVTFAFQGERWEISQVAFILWRYLFYSSNEQPYFREAFQAWWLQAHPELTEDQFPAVYKHWRSQLRARGLQDEDWLLRDLAGRLDDKKANLLADKLRTVIEILLASLDFLPQGEGEADYATQVVNLLNERLPQFQSQLDQLQSTLGTEVQLRFSPSEEQALVAQVIAAHQESRGEDDPLSDAEKAQLQEEATTDLATELNQQETTLKETRQTWVKELRQPDPQHAKVQEIERNYELGPQFDTSQAISLPGLINISLSWPKGETIPELDPENVSTSPFLFNFFFRIVRQINTNQAEADVNTLTERYDKALEELLEFIKKQFEEQTKTAQDAAKNAVLADLPGAPTPEESGGEASEEEGAPATEASAVAAWQQAAQDWRDLSADQRQQFDSLLAGFGTGLTPAILVDDEALTDLIHQWLTTPPVLSAEAITTNANAFRTQLAAALQALASESPPRPDRNIPPVEPAVDAQQAADLRNKAQQAQVVYTVSRAKFQLLNQINDAIRAELTSLNNQNQFGLSDTDIDQLLRQQESQLSQDLWYKLLEAGALTGEIPYTTLLANIWSQLADDYFQRIVIQIPQIETYLQTQPGYSSTDPRFFRQWLKSQQLKEFQASLDAELVAELDPTLVAQALTYADSLETVALDDQLKQYILAQAGVSGPDQEAFIEAVFAQVRLIRTARDGDSLRAAYRQLFSLLQVQAFGDEQENNALNPSLQAKRWYQVFFTDPLLYSVIFATPEIAEAKQYITEFQQRWAQLAQTADTPLSARQQKIITYFAQSESAAAAEPAGQAFQPRQLPGQQDIDWEFALNLIVTSELERSQQDAIETAVYTYFVLNRNQPIRLQSVLIMIQDASQLNVDANGNLSPQELQALSQTSPEYGGFISNGIADRQTVQRDRNAAAASRERLQAAIGAAKIAAFAATGQWHLAAKELLTNPALQKQLIEIGRKAQRVAKKAVPYAALGGFGLFINAILNNPLIKAAIEVAKFAKAVIENPIKVASRLWDGVKSIFGGSEAEAAGIEQLSGLSREAAGLGSQATQAASQVASTPGNISAAAAQAGTGQGILTVLAASTMGPAFLVVILTIIVITVIGSSLNDLPLGYEVPEEYLNELGMLNTTDMACLTIDRSSFRTKESLEYIQMLEEASVKVMQHPGMRRICEALGEPVILFYNPPGTGLPSAGYNYAYGRTLGGGIKIGISPAWTKYGIAQSFTIAHELGHISQHNLNYTQFMFEAFGRNMRITTYPLANSMTESQAEALGLTYWVDSGLGGPCPYRGCTYDIRDQMYNGKNIYQTVHQYLQTLAPSP